MSISHILPPVPIISNSLDFTHKCGPALLFCVWLHLPQCLSTPPIHDISLYIHTFSLFVCWCLGIFQTLTRVSDTEVNMVVPRFLHHYIISFKLITRNKIVGLYVTSFLFCPTSVLFWKVIIIYIFTLSMYSQHFFIPRVFSWGVSVKG